MSRDDLAQRVRALVATQHDVREVSMFGGLAFMVDGEMAVCARRDASLLVRVDPADHDAHLQNGAHPAMMGDHRTMGTGWVAVPEARLSDESLARWLEIGVDSRKGRT